MDSTDRALLNLLQEGIPLTEEPYRDLGERLEAKKRWRNRFARLTGKAKKTDAV